MSNNRQETVVQWLMGIDKRTHITIEEWQQAKEMFEEQIKKSFEEGMFHHLSGHCPIDYYNETYGKE
jgi:hypothetical protein